MQEPPVFIRRTAMQEPPVFIRESFLFGSASTGQAEPKRKIPYVADFSSFDEFYVEYMKFKHGFEISITNPYPIKLVDGPLTEICVQNAEKKLDTCVQNAEKKQNAPSSSNKTWPCQADFSSYEEYRAKYEEIVVGSEGFISFPDPTSMISGGIRPCSVNGECVKDAARVAIEKHNETMGANITLMKIVRANSQFQNGAVFFLTLETLDEGQTVFKEAKVQEYMDGHYELFVGRVGIKPWGNADSSTERSAQRYQKSGSESQELDFFEAHKDEQWLKNKYHPANLLRVFGRRKLRVQMIARDFLTDLSRGIVDLSPRATTFCSSKLWQTGAADGCGKRRKHESSAAPEAHPVSCLPIRIHSDIGLASALIRKLDIEKGIKDNVLCNINYYREFNRESMFQLLVVKCLITERVLYGTQLLDTLLTYLWRVHGVDYYGMIESDKPEGFRHVRPDGKDHGEASEYGNEWKNKLVLFWSERLIGPVGRSKLKLKWKLKGKLDAAAIQDLYRCVCVCKTYDEKYGWMYGCVADGCEELFHCAEFAHEHLKLKHPEVEMELVSLFHEEVYRHNYESDPDALRGSWWTLEMQQA